MPLLDELLVGLGFEYDPADLKEFKDDVSKTTDVIKKLIGVAVAGATAITGLVVASTAATDEQGKLATEIGESVEKIDALRFALQIAGGSADGMSTSLTNLAIRSSEAARGIGSGVEAFGLLGISSTDLQGNLKSTADLMLEISESFKGLDRAKQIELADKLGIRDSIRLLQLGPDAIRELTDEAAELGVITEEDAAIAAEFQDSLVKLWKAVKQGARLLSRELAPVMTGLVTTVTDWWKVNRQLIEQNLPQWIDKATTAIKFLAIATGIWLALRLTMHLIALISLFKGLTLAALFANAAALLLPTLIAGGVAAMALLVEDAKTFFEGGESFIGDMIEKFPLWANEIRVVAAIFATVSDLTTKIFDGWSLIIGLFDKLSFANFKEVLGNIPGFLGDITGISPLESRIPELSNGTTNSSVVKVDKVEITVPGAGDPGLVAEAVFNVFQQTSQDLNTVVDQ